MEIGLYISGAVFILSVIVGLFWDEFIIDLLAVVSAIGVLIFAFGLR